MLSFASLGSGSKGNATLIKSGNTTVLLDCGFALYETEKRLSRLDCNAKSIDAILVTHEHGDHSSGVGKLSRKYNIPVWLTAGTYHACKDTKFSSTHFIDPHTSFQIDEMGIHPFPVPHDAREPCQFVFSRNNHRLGILTDVGNITPCIVESLNGVDALLLECNYDDHKLRTGPYPQGLKNRVAGNYGHLDNQQAKFILDKIETKNLQFLIGMHMSEKNNHLDEVMNVLSTIKTKENNSQAVDISIACQKNGFNWKKIL